MRPILCTANSYTGIIYEGVWRNLAPFIDDWFPEKKNASSLVKFSYSASGDQCVFTYSDGAIMKSTFDQEGFFKSFYTVKDVILN